MLTFTFLDKPPEDLIIASSDSDLQPAVRIIKNRNENTKLIYLGFGGYLNKGLSYTTDHTIAIRDSEITEFYKEQKPLISQ